MRILLIGPPLCGKTAFVKRLLNLPFDSSYIPTPDTIEREVGNDVYIDCGGGIDKTLMTISVEKSLDVIIAFVDSGFQSHSFVAFATMLHPDVRLIKVQSKSDCVTLGSASLLFSSKTGHGVREVINAIYNLNITQIPELVRSVNPLPTEVVRRVNPLPTEVDRTTSFKQ